MKETNYKNLTEAEREMLNHVLPLVSNYVETVINEKVAQAVSVYLNLPLTVEMVAALLNEKPATIYKWHQRGRLNFTHKGGRLTITLQEMNRQLTNEEVLKRLHESITNY